MSKRLEPTQRRYMDDEKVCEKMLSIIAFLRQRKLKLQ